METAFFVVLLAWIGILVCISQSAVFSGMNLALFSISRLRLEVEADLGPLLEADRSQQKKMGGTYRFDRRAAFCTGFGCLSAGRAFRGCAGKPSWILPPSDNCEKPTRTPGQHLDIDKRFLG